MGRKPTDTTRPGYKPGGVTGKGFLPGQCGNIQGGRNHRKVLLTNALKDAIAASDNESGLANAEVIARDFVRLILKCGKKKSLSGIHTKAVEVLHDITEGRPKQKVEVSGNLSGDRAERVKELLAGALERAGSALK